MTEPALPFGPDFGFGIYFHWPYCARICPYCDFNVYAAKDRDTGPLLQAMLADLETQAAGLAAHPPLTSIFLGGGTPSLMTPVQIEALIETCDTLFGLASNCEISLEANPNNITREAAKDWRSAGINRLSIGLQSLDDAALGFLGRDHTVSDAINGCGLGLSAFPTSSIDMIYARPGQSPADWKKELEAALDLGAPHLSLYELTIAPGTAFFKATERGHLTPMPDDAQAELYEITAELTETAGLPAYEVSNHAVDQDHQSRHNMIYWQSGDWLGIGPGAHGRLSVAGVRTATEAVSRPGDYIKRVQSHGAGLATSEPLSDIETAHELLVMGLRPVAGIKRHRVEALLQRKLSEEKLEHMREGGWLTDETEHLSLTPSGRLLADRIALELLS